MSDVVFSHHASVFRIGKNPVALVLFAQSVTLSVLCVLIGRSVLRFLPTGDIDRSLLAVHASCSDSLLLTRVSANETVIQLKLELRRTSLLCCNFPFVLFQTGLKQERDNK